MRPGIAHGLVALVPVVVFVSSCGEGEPPVDPAPAVLEAVEPEDPDPRLDEALGQISSGRLEDGLSTAERVLAEKPESSRAHFYVGLALHKQKKYSLALPHFERALAIGPTFEPFASVVYFQGWCLYYEGRPAEARAAFEAYLEQEPEEGDAHFALGLIHLEEGELDDAERRFRRAIELNEALARAGDRSRLPDASKAWARLGDVHAQREEHAEARQALERSVQLHPPHHTAWYRLSRVLTVLGEEEAAARAMQEHDRWLARVRPERSGS
ncbi:MAG: tetratricopeptide repeat protein [Planctomycetota bacterium]|nr:tetratricopeptide repeat protein [Planctomycetota bacterium]